MVNPTSIGYETGNRASIRTCSGLGVVGFRVHDLIQCFRFFRGKWDEMLLSCSRIGSVFRSMLTAHRSHLKTFLLTLHRSHLKSSKLFHLGENGRWLLLGRLGVIALAQRLVIALVFP